MSKMLFGKKFTSYFIPFLIFCAVFLGHNAFCDWEKWIGKKFVFREMDRCLQWYGYMDFSKTLDFSEALDYESYVGKRGRIISVLIKEYLKVKLETGEIVYAFGEVPGHLSGVYFVEDYNEAKKLLGRFIWIRQDRVGEKEQRLITEDENVSYPLKHLEKIKVFGIYTKLLGHEIAPGLVKLRCHARIQMPMANYERNLVRFDMRHSYDESPFFLKVATKEAKFGLIPYKRGNFIEEDPYDLSGINKILITFGLKGFCLGMTLSEAEKVLKEKGIDYNLDFSLPSKWDKHGNWYIHFPYSLYLGDVVVLMEASPFSQIVYSIDIFSVAPRKKIEEFLVEKLGEPYKKSTVSREWYKPGAKIDYCLEHLPIIWFTNEPLEEKSKKEAKKLQSELKKRGLKLEEWLKEQKVRRKQGFDVKRWHEQRKKEGK